MTSLPSILVGRSDWKNPTLSFYDDDKRSSLFEQLPVGRMIRRPTCWWRTQSCAPSWPAHGLLLEPPWQCRHPVHRQKSLAFKKYSPASEASRGVYWNMSQKIPPPLYTESAQYLSLFEYKGQPGVNFIKALTPEFFIGVKMLKNIFWCLKRQIFWQHISSNMLPI